MTELFTVFGSDGFVGRRLVRQLTAQGHRVQSVGRDESFDTGKMSLGNVLYCAGVTGSRFKTEQFRVVDAHVSSMAAVLERGKFESFLYMSSARTYEDSLGGTDESSQFRVDPSRISDFYNLSKLMGESLILNSGIQCVRIARVSYAVDIADDSADNLTEFVRAARTGTVRFGAHRNSVKDYVVMEDILNALPLIALQGGSRVYNVASGRNTSTSEIAQMLIEETGCNVEFADDESVRSPQPIDVSLLQNEMSFRPQGVLDYARRVIRSEVRS